MRPLTRTAAETARLLGVSVKALRVYERHGLVRPQRTEAGWRVYGPNELLRLHQIRWRKRWGLKLSQIKDLLQDRVVDLDTFLSLLQRDLAQRKDSIIASLHLIEKARATLAQGGSLTVDELIALTKEANMPEETPEWVKKITPLVDRHLSDDEQQELRKRKQDYGDANKQWAALIAEAKSLVGTDPGAPAALDLARRWNKLVATVVGANPDVRAKLADLWRDASANPQIAPSLPFTFTPDVIAFIQASSSKLSDAY